MVLILPKSLANFEHNNKASELMITIKTRKPKKTHTHSRNASQMYVNNSLLLLCQDLVRVGIFVLFSAVSEFCSPFFFVATMQERSFGCRISQ